MVEQSALRRRNWTAHSEVPLRPKQILSSQLCAGRHHWLASRALSSHSLYAQKLWITRRSVVVCERIDSWGFLRLCSRIGGLSTTSCAAWVAKSHCQWRRARIIASVLHQVAHLDGICRTRICLKLGGRPEVTSGG